MSTLRICTNVCNNTYCMIPPPNCHWPSEECFNRLKQNDSLDPFLIFRDVLHVNLLTKVTVHVNVGKILLM
jgi:hypothetical protein